MRVVGKPLGFVGGEEVGVSVGHCGVDSGVGGWMLVRSRLVSWVGEGR